MSYVSLATKVFGNFSKSLNQYFIDIKEDIHKANMNYTLEEYISMAIMTIVITFVIEVFVLSFTFSLFFDFIVSFLLSLTLSATISGILLFLFYSYPATVSKSRSHEIKKTLPFATTYLTALASSRLPPASLFKTLAKFREYGKVADEAAAITRDIEMFGMSFSSAIKKQTKRTPSREFADLLWGINTITVSGGDLVIYLKQKGEEMMSDYRRNIRKYAQDLSLYVEIYLTLIITGAIFFIVLSSVISTISGGAGTIAVQSFVVFILLPFLSIGFIMLIKSISPTE